MHAKDYSFRLHSTLNLCRVSPIVIIFQTWNGFHWQLEEADSSLVRPLIQKIILNISNFYHFSTANFKNFCIAIVSETQCIVYRAKVVASSVFSFY